MKGEEKLADEELVDNGIALPTIAPATPRDDLIQPSPIPVPSPGRSRVNSLDSGTDRSSFQDASPPLESSVDAADLKRFV